MNFRHIKYTDVKKGMFIVLTNSICPKGFGDFGRKGFLIISDPRPNSDKSISFDAQLYRFDCFFMCQYENCRVEKIDVGLVVDYSYTIYAIDTDEMLETIAKINRLHGIFKTALDGVKTQISEGLKNA